MTQETPRATGRAFAELRAVIEARSGKEGFLRVLDGLSPAAREAARSENDGATYPDELFAEALQVADALDPEGEGALARAIGHARAESEVEDGASAYGGDALKFLREQSARFYRGRTTYGASSVEVMPSKAVVRLVVPEHLARRVGELPNPGPWLAHGFLERSVELVSGVPQSPRYVGHAPRIDARFDRPMVNLVFEFDLEPA